MLAYEISFSSFVRNALRNFCWPLKGPLVRDLCSFQNFRWWTKFLTSETVQGASLPLEGIDDVHGSDCLPLAVLSIGHSICVDVFQKNFEESSRLLVDRGLIYARRRDTQIGSQILRPNSGPRPGPRPVDPKDPGTHAEVYSREYCRIWMCRTF